MLSGDGEIPISSSSSSCSSSSSSSSDSDLFSESDADDEGSVEEEKPRAANPPVTKGELTLLDLPPIENLKIEVQLESLFHIGRVSAIVDLLVVVQSFKNMPALNLDSVLFLKDGKPLGHVFDVFGRVVEPLYSVRFNNMQEIEERKVLVDMPVYIASDYPPPVTEFVFYSQLQQMKGSDASWKHNNEPPDHVKFYSDDEEERRDQLKQRAKRKGCTTNSSETPFKTNLEGGSSQMPPQNVQSV